MSGERGSVVVTGASTGIGEATAKYLAQKRYRVFAGVRKEADAEKIRQLRIEQLQPLILDVCDVNSIQAAARVVESAVGGAGVHGLVNNAGVAVAGPLEFIPVEEFCRQLEVNVTGQLAVTQAFLPSIRKARGRLVFVSSIGGRRASPLLGPYGASKHALEGMCDSLRMELAPWRIEVSVIEPGAVKTPIWEKSRATNKAVRDNFPPQAEEYYGYALDRLEKLSEEMNQQGVEALEVAKAADHALSSLRPRTRYLVGRDAWLQAQMKQWLPDRTMDRLVLNFMKLNRRAPDDRTS